MSWTNFTKAFELAPQCKRYNVGTGVSKDVVEMAEKKLNVHFSQQLKEYLSKYAYLQFKGYEFFGIWKADFSGIPGNGIVEFVLEDREKYKLPQKWIPIQNLDDGYMAFQDYSISNEQGEPPVVEALYSGQKYEVTGKLADDLGDFILHRVKTVLEWQENEK